MTRRNAEDLLRAALAAVPNSEPLAALFAADGVVELPFLASIGIPWRYQGRPAIAGFYDTVKGLYPDMAFHSDDTVVHIASGNRVLAEYATCATAARTGRRIHHRFIGYLIAEHGEIKLLREFLNVFGAAQALFPAGLAAFPNFTQEVNTTSLDYHP